MQLSSLQAVGLLQQQSGTGRANDAAQMQAKEEVAKQFEGVFVSMLLKQLRESLDEGIFGGENSDTFGAMFDMYLGEHVAQNSNLGIRDLVLSQLPSPQQQGMQL